MMQLKCKAFQTILKTCQENGITINGACGGNGTCGKCKIKVINGDVPPSRIDFSYFSPKEIKDGFRLACHAVPQTECVIELSDVQTKMDIVSDGVMIKGVSFYYNIDSDKLECASFDENRLSEKKEKIICVDIGTTTLVVKLCIVGGGECRELACYVAGNRQSSFGADVISRIQASVEGNQERLTECIRQQLAEGIANVIEVAGENLQRDDDEINRILIVGNTTMIHLLMGYDCETLGRAPFTPVTTDGIRMQARELFDKNSSVYIFPGISAFVGGDIVSGLYAVEFMAADRPQIFLDLGTNGEMAIGNKNGILVASAAAGPAFEGGNIACGMASIKGAISKAVLLGDNKWELTTIQSGKPIGICGSGLIEIIYELYKKGIIDETGLLCEGEIDEFLICEETKVYITQKDIRMFQMAKAAICAGLETLIKEYGIVEEEIDKVWIAGGFASYLDIAKATAVGLFPKQLQNKIICAGNTALSGLQKYALKCEAESDLLRIKQHASEVALANNPHFEELLIQNMYL